MAKLRIGVTAVALALLAPVLVAAPAHAADVTSTAKITSTPDDGTPPWARDTFDRTTTITETGENAYKVTVADKGEFTTAEGTKTPGDKGETVEGEVTGQLDGTMTFTVSGRIRSNNGIRNRQERDARGYDHTRFKVKSDVPAARQSSKWALLYFRQGSTIEEFTYNWKYTTPCEEMTQSTDGGVEGNITGKKCPEPEPEWRSSVITAKADCHITPGTRQTWTLTRTPESEQTRRVTAIAWVYYPHSKYDKAHSYGPSDDPNDGWTYLGRVWVPEGDQSRTVTTPYGGGLAVHYWDGHAKKVKLWTTSDHRVTC